MERDPRIHYPSLLGAVYRPSKEPHGQRWPLPIPQHLQRDQPLFLPGGNQLLPVDGGREGERGKETIRTDCNGHRRLGHDADPGEVCLQRVKYKGVWSNQTKLIIL